MSDDEASLTVMAEWIHRAEEDLDSAVHLLGRMPRRPTNAICFHAQQAVEKYLKSLLVHEGTDFPKTHDIEELVALLRSPAVVELGVEEQRRLTLYATRARYPGWPDVSLVEARRAVALARRVRRAIRRLLPRSAVRRSRGVLPTQ
jgi:HEPN domain-containing protein